MAKRTTHRSSKGTKLYAVRTSKGRFSDIQSYKRAHSADLKKKGTRSDRSMPFRCADKAGCETQRICKAIETCAIRILHIQKVLMKPAVRK